MENNPAIEANRGLLGTDEDPSGHGVKERLRSDPDSQPEAMHAGRDAVLDTETQARAQTLISEDQGTETDESTSPAPGDNLS